MWKEIIIKCDSEHGVLSKRYSRNFPLIKPFWKEEGKLKSMGGIKPSRQKLWLKLWIFKLIIQLNFPLKNDWRKK